MPSMGGTVPRAPLPGNQLFLGLRNKSCGHGFFANRLAQHPKCRILHSPDPAQSCGIGFLSFAEGVDAGKMRETLYNKYNIITAYMPHKLYSGLRITPNVYSTIRDIDYFSEVVEKEL